MPVHMCIQILSACELSLYAKHASQMHQLKTIVLGIAVHDHQLAKLRNMADEQDTITVGEVGRTGNQLRKDLNEKRADWKSKLSAALNSEQIFFSLLILSIFYAGYTLGNGIIHINDDKHEDDITERCHCKSSHQKFYCAWFGICCFIWLILHSYTYVAIRFPAWGNCLKVLKPWKSCNCRKKSEDAVDSTGSDIDKIQHFIEILWFQYYKLFVVGYPKHYEKVLLDSNHESANESNTNNESSQKEEHKVTCCCCIAEASNNFTFVRDPAVGRIANSFRCANHSFLLTVKFLAQLFTIPLLFLQVFDTYSLLCFNPQWFCSDAIEYNLHLAQALITLLFYCCLAMSQLASTMLTWNPWPKKDGDKDKQLS